MGYGPSIQPNSLLHNTLGKRKSGRHERERKREREMARRRLLLLLKSFDYYPMRQLNGHSRITNPQVLPFICSALFWSGVRWNVNSLRGPSYMNHFLKWVLLVFFVFIVFVTIGLVVDWAVELFDKLSKTVLLFSAICLCFSWSPRRISLEN
jgi:hypothetical protein